MNNKQKTMLWLGLAAIILMGLFPPIKYPGSYTGRRSIFRSRNRGISYEFIFDTRGTLDLSKLVVQWVVVALGTGGLIYAFKDKKPKDQKQ